MSERIGRATNGASSEEVRGSPQRRRHLSPRSETTAFQGSAYLVHSLPKPCTYSLGPKGPRTGLCPPASTRGQALDPRGLFLCHGRIEQLVDPFHGPAEDEMSPAQGLPPGPSAARKGRSCVALSKSLNLSELQCSDR